MKHNFTAIAELVRTFVVLIEKKKKGFEKVTMIKIKMVLSKTTLQKQ